MDEPSQQHLAAGLEAEWIELFKVAVAGSMAHSARLSEAVPVLLVEMETLLFLRHYEQRPLARARRLMQCWNTLRRWLPCIH